MKDPLSFIHELQFANIPAQVVARVKLNLLDLIGVAISGRTTNLSQIITTHASQQFGGTRRMMFSDLTASPAGVALATGMTIDAIDAHDGYNLAKGHIGCPLFAGMFALAHELTGKDALATLVMGYEFGARASVAQHRTVADYHTSGSWGAVTVAATGARLLGLDDTTTRHALGIAEYHGPRSQMMRVIDHPTMLKDGSGWGAMTGVSASYLAQSGFTGAPANTVENASEFWADLGHHWATLDQYFKPYPVCRWAQAPIEAALSLKAKHKFTSTDIAGINVETFHESVRLATHSPQTTEEAQYSTSYPCAVALVFGDVQPNHVTGDALANPEVLRISRLMTFKESPYANAAFPQTRLARVRIALNDGKMFESDWYEPRWDPYAPPTEAEITNKFTKLFDGLISEDRGERIVEIVSDLENHSFQTLARCLYEPIIFDAKAGKSA